ncbi:MAG: hypothetical protein M0R49_06365 [Limnochordia bacterium]|nr:hypothetical protein [Limnochordia bacterium]
MRKIRRHALLFVTLVAIALLSGCLGSGSSTPKTYKLTVTVLNDVTGTALEGALVEVVGKSLDTQETNVSGKVTFAGLSGTVEVLSGAPGFESKSQSIVMNKEQSITIRLAVDESVAVVNNEEDIANAINDPEVTSISFADDMVLATPLVIDRPINLNLYGKTLTGDVEYTFEDEESLELVGTGQIIGNLTIDAPNASVLNRLHVTGDILIHDVASETWNEYASDNRLVVVGSDIRLNVYNGARSIEIVEDTSGIRVNIHQGPVADFIANSSVQVVGADKIAHATVNAYGVVFDLSPGTVDGEYDPTIIQSFVPGSGGVIAAFTPSTAPANTFAGLYVDRNHRWPSFNSTTGHPEVDMYFPTPASLGGDGYELQYFDSADSTWKSYEDVETSSADSDNFSLTFWEATTFRLLMIGGPLNGYTSNEIEVVPSSVHTYFSSWGMSAVSSYVGEMFIGNATAKRISDGAIVDDEYLTYQWYRVDPNTFEMKQIPGANATQYTTQDADVGSAILFKATGDGVNIGGFTQVWAPNFWGKVIQPILIPNKAFISDVTSNGFTLNLHKNVPNLSKDQLELWAYGFSAPDEPLVIQSIEFVPGSQAKFIVEVEIPAGLESLWLTAQTDHWGIVSNYREEGHHPYIRPEVQYRF